MSIAEFLVMAAKIWGVCGAGVAVLFLSFGMDRVDEDARGAYVFRPLILPGVLLIWPLVLWRWYILADGKDEWAARHKPRRTNHQPVALAMSIAIVLVILAGLSVRQTWPADIAPVQLSTGADQ